MVDRHTVEQPHHNPADIPAENVERQGDDELSVFEWFCPDCEEWLGWPDTAGQPARRCSEPAECPHADERAACGHVVCGHCGALADSHEWVLEGEQAGTVARQIFDDGPDPETAIRQALLEDLQRVTQGADVEDVLEQRRDLFEEYAQQVEDSGDENEG